MAILTTKTELLKRTHQFRQCFNKIWGQVIGFRVASHTLRRALTLNTYEPLQQQHTKKIRRKSISSTNKMNNKRHGITSQGLLISKIFIHLTHVYKTVSVEKLVGHSRAASCLLYRSANLPITLSHTDSKIYLIPDYLLIPAFTPN